ncbi:MAG TPA: MFS transporter [Verrucomicrobiae bacterium]|nr:MFS transporter [Verrucomicrobiae bacterium]
MTKAGKFRWVICALLFALISLCYMDRLIIGPLKEPISKQFGWSEENYANIAAAFSFAYAFGYLFAGRAIDIFKLKRGLPVFVFVWSLAEVGHGLINFIGRDAQLQFHYPWFSFADKGLVWMTLVTPMSVAGFVVGRTVLGLAEGADFPAAVRAVAEWFPVKERAFATGWFNAGSNFGAIVAPILVTWICLRYGWSLAFYLVGVLGLVWVIVWWLFYDDPARHHRLKPAELDYIRGSQPQVAEKAVKVPWLSLFRYRSVWAFVIASILAGPAWGFYQFFISDFIHKRYHTGLLSTGLWTSAFYFLTGIGGIFAGWLAGKLMDRGWSLNTARKVSLLICALAVVPVFTAPFAPSVLLAVLIVGLAGSAHQGWTANLFSFVSDTMPKEAISSVIGLGGFVAYFTGGFVNALTGIILQKTGSYVWVFAYFSGMYVLSLLLMQLLVPKITDTQTGLARRPAEELNAGRTTKE